jgi:hypothetical protein
MLWEYLSKCRFFSALALIPSLERSGSYAATVTGYPSLCTNLCMHVSRSMT